MRRDRAPLTGPGGEDDLLPLEAGGRDSEQNEPLVAVVQFQFVVVRGNHYGLAREKVTRARVPSLQ